MGAIVMLFLLTALGVIVIFVAARALYKTFVEEPSPFAASIARSLVDHPNEWDYDVCGVYVRHDTAGIEIGVKSFFGHVKSTDRPNRGSATIDQLAWADMHAFRIAYEKWQSLTASARQQVAERRKREIMLRLGDTAVGRWEER